MQPGFQGGIENAWFPDALKCCGFLKLYITKHFKLQQGHYIHPRKFPACRNRDTPYRRKCPMACAALIKAVYEVDPLQCPKHVVSLSNHAPGTMKIISFIEDDAVIERILKHCGKWKVGIARSPPIPSTTSPVSVAEEPLLDYSLSLSFSNV
ncbi:hypothetical protein CHISP_3471 [Chitinispirillum alkaliphilum]|nr:hypothetical protein CHISP_3471 [Chitinispirillum alkaliphilum]